MNSRRLLLIVGIIVLLAIVGVGIYFILSPKSATTGTQTGQLGTLPSTGTKSTGSGGTGSQNNTSSSAGVLPGITNTPLAKSFGVIANVPALAYFVSPSNAVTIVEPDGEIVQVVNGNTTTLNSLQIQNIITAGFSYDGSKVLVNFGDPSNPQTSIFDISSQAWTPMPAGWQSPSWSPSDYRIAYITQTANNTETFSTFDPTQKITKAKSATVSLATLHAEDLSLAWLNKNQLIIQTKPSALVTGSIWDFNLINKTFNPITTEVPGVEAVWEEPSMVGASTAMGLEFSAGTSANGASLNLIDGSGNILQAMSFLTLPSKCTFTATTSTVANNIAMTSSTASGTALNVAPESQTTSTPYLYCAVPRDQEGLSQATLPDNYNQMALFTSDDIYQIDLTSGASNAVFTDQSQNVDVSAPQFMNNTFFFINRYDQKLYAIQLSTEH